MMREFCMTEEQYTRLLDACKPVPYMIVGGMPPPRRRHRRTLIARGRRSGQSWGSTGRRCGQYRGWASVTSRRNRSRSPGTAHPRGGRFPACAGETRKP